MTKAKKPDPVWWEAPSEGTQALEACYDGLMDGRFVRYRLFEDRRRMYVRQSAYQNYLDREIALKQKTLAEDS